MEIKNNQFTPLTGLTPTSYTTLHVETEWGTGVKGVKGVNNKGIWRFFLNGFSDLSAQNTLKGSYNTK